MMSKVRVAYESDRHCKLCAIAGDSYSILCRRLPRLRIELQREKILHLISFGTRSRTLETMKQAAQRTLSQVARCSARPNVAAYRPRPAAAAVRPFSSTRFHLEQQQPGAKPGEEAKQEDQQQQKKQQAKEEEPDTTVAGRSPFAAFVEVLREEVRKNREWQDSVKQLGGEVGKVQDSEAMKRAKDAYERARVSLPVFLILSRSPRQCC